MATLSIILDYKINHVKKNVEKYIDTCFSMDFITLLCRV